MRLKSRWSLRLRLPGCVRIGSCMHPTFRISIVFTTIGAVLAASGGARVDPSQASTVLKAVEGNELTRGRSESHELRAQMSEITTFDKVKLDRWTSTFSRKIDGWDGSPVEAWRAETMMFYIDALLSPISGQSSATREWLEPWLDLTAMRRESSSFVGFFLYQTDASHLGRNWLRWAFRTLQATRKTSSGTPVDNQIGSYLVDADFLVTADKVFASIAERIAAEKVVPIARPVLVTVENCVSKLIDLIV